MTAPEITVTVSLEMPNQDHLFEHIKTNARYGREVIGPHSADGKRLVICGAGPSIAQQHDAIRTTPAHQVWGCNSALPYLRDHGLPVTHGITVDMSEEMFTDVNEWQRTFPVTYLVSSGVHPKLIPHLKKDNRRVKMFHSFLGIKDPEGWTPPPDWIAPRDFEKNHPDQFRTYEMYLYTHRYPPTVQVGYGLNTVPRAICLALWMGFKQITVFGADCAVAPDRDPMPPTDDPGYVPWLKSLKLYPDGRADPTQSTPAKYGDNAVMCEGLILGRRWHTRPDMLVSAKHLVDLVGLYPDRLTLMGDTLPNAILGLPPAERGAYLKTIPTLTGKGSVAGFRLTTREKQPLTPTASGG